MIAAGMSSRRHGLPSDAKSRRALAYCRVGPNEPSTSVPGVPAQTTAINDYARRHGLLVVERFADEGVGGDTPLAERPQVLAAIRALGAGDTLLVSRLDRLARGDVFEHAVIDELVERRGAQVVSCSGEGAAADNPAGAAVRDLLRLVANFERDLTRARTKAALAAKKARGERVGAVPYGQTEIERRILALIAKRRAAGDSLGKTADELNRRGLTTRRGTPWRPQYIASLVATAKGAAEPAAKRNSRPTRVAPPVARPQLRKK
jgi:DNA invertase Pin-like site-specific DNA recombinase